MSINDAIEILEKAIEAQKDNRDMLQALTKAVKALQTCRDTKMKQQPRKVATRYARKEFYCPACKKHIRDIYRNKGRYSFCDVCGQKIDWRLRHVRKKKRCRSARTAITYIICQIKMM